MNDTSPYVPSGGLRGKLVRFAASRLARDPMRIRLGRPLVSITFDDFPQSAATLGKDSLERRGWRGTYFASGGFAGQTTHHGSMYEPSDIASLLGDGHEIGCHTFSHFDLGQAPMKDVTRDVARNAEFLARLGVGLPLAVFAYPYGETSPAVKKMLGCRFRALRSVRPGVNRDGADRRRLLAVGIDGGRAGIERAVASASAVAQEPGWLIYYAHDIQDDPTPWGCTQAQFEEVLDAVAATGAEVLPVGEALDRIGAVSGA